jgi:virginiamycin A acetyltransferase
MPQVHAPPPWKPDALTLAAQSDARARHILSGILTRAYKFRRLRNLVQKLCLKLEGGPMFSATWRQILRDAHGVQVGAYSYGDILKPGLLPRGTSVGRYCSVGTALIVRRRNHPIERPFLHPFFYNSRLGLLQHDTIEADRDNPLSIGHDVWIADRVTILGGCRVIGNGAVIAAGAILTQDVPAYAVVAGVPARQIKFRFAPDQITELETSQWWQCPIVDLIASPPVLDIFGLNRHCAPKSH